MRHDGPRLVARRTAVSGLLGVAVRLEWLALRLAEPEDGDQFDAELSCLLDALQARRAALRGPSR